MKTITRKFWTEDEIEILERRYPDEPTDRIAADLGRTIRSVYCMAMKLGLCKSEQFRTSPYACRLTGTTGVGTRFQKGHTTWNRGKPHPSRGRSAETQFKAGERHGPAADNYRQVGEERLSKDGYLERKIHDGMPLQSRWRAVHLIIWEEVNGPMPQGHAVVFRDGNKQNICLENLELISRQELMRRNTIQRFPKELKEVIRLQGKLKRTIARKNEKQD